MLLHLCRPDSGVKPSAATFSAVLGALADAASAMSSCSAADVVAVRSQLTAVMDALVACQPAVQPDAVMYANMVAAFFQAGKDLNLNCYTVKRRTLWRRGL